MRHVLLFRTIFRYSADCWGFHFMTGRFLKSITLRQFEAHFQCIHSFTIIWWMKKRLFQKLHNFYSHTLRPISINLSNHVCCFDQNYILLLKVVAFRGTTFHIVLWTFLMVKVIVHTIHSSLHYLNTFVSHDTFHVSRLPPVEFVFFSFHADVHIYMQLYIFQGQNLMERLIRMDKTGIEIVSVLFPC